MSIFADLNSFQQIVIRNAIRKRLLFLFSTIIFFIIIYCYYKNHLREGAGVDILWRVTEAKYFLMGINPFDVLVGKTSIIPDFGAPAAYTYISYITVIPFAFLTDKTSILLIFSLIDFFCLYAGVFLNRKLIGAKYSLFVSILS